MARKDAQIRKEMQERYVARKQHEEVLQKHEARADASSVLTQKYVAVMQELIDEQTTYTDQLLEIATKKQRPKK